MKICPASGICPHPNICARLCTRLHAAPLDTLEAPTMVHFVGFRGEEYRSAVRAFGLPDFIHRVWDQRAHQEIAPGDVVIFAKPYPTVSRYSYDDSAEPNDPATLERQ